MSKMSFFLLVLFQLFFSLKHLASPVLAVEFIFNSFAGVSNGSNLNLISDARIESSVIRFTSNSDKPSFGRAFYATKLRMKPSSNSTFISSFSTSFVFSILPQMPNSPGFGLAFVLSNTTSPPGAFASQYFGLFTNSPVPGVAPLFAVEFDTGRHPEYNDPDDNHIGIDLNNVVSEVTQTAGYYNSSGGFVPIWMRDGSNVRTWIDFDGSRLQINVTVAPVGIPRPLKPTLVYADQKIANYLSAEMYVGFSASKTNWLEAQRLLAWSLSDTGPAREINTTNLPDFEPVSSSSSSLSASAIVGIIIGCLTFVVICVSGIFWWWRKNRLKEEPDEVEDWELEYWPHRFSYEELSQATSGFSNDRLLGSGGFGRVYKGTMRNKTEVAVKCVSHDSKQGLREFMAEISSMGRLQHKNLVQMRGWCRKRNELMLVYDYMPNGSLNKWIFDKTTNPLSWEQRRGILIDVAEGLNYLHHGWDQVVIHRDIKSSNILLDSDMRGRLGDFGLAKLYQHGEVPNTTRVVGTLGYLAPEIATISAPTAASDVYSFGVVVLEVACGRRPIEIDVPDEQVVLIDWVRELYADERAYEAADQRIKDEYDVGAMDTILKLGLACCHPEPQRRPSMKQVAAVLVGEDAAAAPTDLSSEFGRNGGGADKSGGGSGNFNMRQVDQPENDPAV